LKLVRLILAIILPLVLILAVCPAVQADDDKAEVDLKVEVVPPPPPPPPAVGVGPPPVYYIRTNLLGIEERYRISSQGKILETIEAVSEDGMLPISIPKGTIALDKDGRRLKSLGVLVDETPPPPPEDTHIIGLAYDFGPDGATFAPPIELLIHYDPKELPENVSSIFVAYYDEQQGWMQLEPISGFVAAVGIVTAEVSHFTTFAIIAAVAPPPPPVPAAFSVSNLTVQPPELEPGEAVTITVSVATTGGSEGSYSMVLRINGAAEATKEVTIHAGFSEEVTFTISRDIAGTYSVDVDGLTGSFTVKEKPVVPVVPKPVNWPLIGGIIAAVVIAGLVVFFLVRRRTGQ